MMEESQGGSTSDVERCANGALQEMQRPKYTLLQCALLCVSARIVRNNDLKSQSVKFSKWQPCTLSLKSCAQHSTFSSSRRVASEGARPQHHTSQLRITIGLSVQGKGGAEAQAALTRSCNLAVTDQPTTFATVRQR